MLRKLDRDYIAKVMAQPDEVVQDGTMLGLIKGDHKSFKYVDPSIYDRLHDVDHSKITCWANLFVCRAYDERLSDGKSLFDDVAEIYEIFGCPEELIPFVYFETSNGPASPMLLFGAIETHVSAVKASFREFRGHDT